LDLVEECGVPVGSFELDVVIFEFRWIEFDEFNLLYGLSTHFYEFSDDQSVLGELLNAPPAILIHQREIVRAIIGTPFVSFPRWHPEVLRKLVLGRGRYHVEITLVRRL